MSNMQSKEFWKSKTLWANLIMALGVNAFSWFGDNISPETLTLIYGAVNVGLRFLSKEKLKIK